jgi:hypothetical protein
MILGWRANIDFSPVISIGVVMIYISKYYSKTEVKSETYDIILNTVLG